MVLPPLAAANNFVTFGQATAAPPTATTISSVISSQSFTLPTGVQHHDILQSAASTSASLVNPVSDQSKSKKRSIQHVTLDDSSSDDRADAQAAKGQQLQFHKHKVQVFPTNPLLFNLSSQFQHQIQVYYCHSTVDLVPRLLWNFKPFRIQGCLISRMALLLFGTVNWVLLVIILCIIFQRFILGIFFKV